MKRFFTFLKLWFNSGFTATLLTISVMVALGYACFYIYNHGWSGRAAAILSALFILMVIAGEAVNARKQNENGKCGHNPRMSSTCVLNFLYV